jgi:hypothetical protein
MPLDTYSHAMLNEPGDDLEALRRSVAALYEPAQRRPRGYLGGYPAAEAEEENPHGQRALRKVEDTGLEPVTSTLPG